jgi:hypothetical protein
MNINLKLLLTAGTIFFATIGCKQDSNSNTILLKSDLIAPAQPSTFFNSIEQASFKYTRSDSFKTGKVEAPSLTLAADSLIYYKDKKYQVTLKHFKVGNTMFSMGSLATNNSTVLLFTKENQLQTLEVKGVGAFEYRGVKGDKYYFRLTRNDATTCFSLNLDQSDVLVTEYTVEGD